MSFSIAIIGLPNVGKSTLFKALTQIEVGISNYPFCTIDPNVGLVPLPDQRLEQLAQLLKPPKTTPATIEFIDIAGLVKKAHQGQGLGNQFLAQIRPSQVICQVVRAFPDKQISHPQGEINPLKDIEIINAELIFKDLETVEKRISKLNKEARAGSLRAKKEMALLNQAREQLKRGRLISQIDLKKEEAIKQLQLLTAKEMIYLINGPEGSVELPPEYQPRTLFLDVKFAEEANQLSPAEQKELGLEEEALEQLIKKCYQLLGLITFYTIAGGQELRAWLIKQGSTIEQAAGLIHTDFQKQFIKAEVIDWQKLLEVGSWAAARQKGLLETKGREDQLKDGQVIEIKI